VISAGILRNRGGHPSRLVVVVAFLRDQQGRIDGRPDVVAVVVDGTGIPWTVRLDEVELVPSGEWPVGWLNPPFRNLDERVRETGEGDG
jgi:hypothetical protein